MAGGQLEAFYLSVDGVFGHSSASFGPYLPVESLLALVEAERSGSDPLAFENFIMGQDLDLSLFPVGENYWHGVTWGDSAEFNLLGNDDIGLTNRDDTFFAGDGNDSIYGNDGDDHLDGGAGNDTLRGSNGDDNLMGSGGDDSCLEMLETTPWGGGNGHDRLYGGRQNDILYGGNGDDGLFGDSGADRIYGGRGDENIAGGAGRDRIFGGDGDDRLSGGSDRDRIFTGEGVDFIYGGGGFDKIVVGAGRSTLTGGKGADDFIFIDGIGSHTIVDFEAGRASEDIILRRVTEITSYDDLVTNHMTQDGADVVIDDGAGLTIRLRNVSLSALNAEDFIF